jgi:hypothetical protein
MIAVAMSTAVNEPLRFGVAFAHEGPASVFALFELVSQLAYD